MATTFGPRRAEFFDVGSGEGGILAPDDLRCFETLDLAYRTLCAILYNYAPTSGHPGGSISSGRMVAQLLFGAMDYDVADPGRDDADQLIYAAGHKALGLYAMWALRDEMMRLGAPDALPSNERHRLRLEDLLGFRKNPHTRTPLFRGFRSRPLDGHPTPATPFVSLATGASGVGMGGALGIALAAADVYRSDPPRIHILEGEGGLTPGRVAEALAFAGTVSLGNAIVHVDWNQASIDSDRVTREGPRPGDYVQWDPMELFHLHDWNVIRVPDGTDLRQVAAAQRMALDLDNGQPTAVIYRTTKGWRYGVEGRASHGAGHPLCSLGFLEAVAPLLEGDGIPFCVEGSTLCGQGRDAEQVEACLWRALEGVRGALERHRDVAEQLAGRVLEARGRLKGRARRPRTPGPVLEEVYGAARQASIPSTLRLEPGTSVPLRTQLGRVLGEINRRSGGALLVSTADLLDSTAASEVVAGLPTGFLNLRTNPDARAFASGGIAEDAMTAILSGVSTFGWHIGVGASYAAFLAPFGHVAARLHAIGNQARQEVDGKRYRPLVLVCGHAGLKTGEDGPTHADPQALQLLQGNFPEGTVITLTPWDPAEIWALIASALVRRPAVIAPFVTRPAERILDRDERGLAPAEAAVSGVYHLRKARRGSMGTVVLQGSDVTYAFLEGALPLLDRDGIDVDVFYVASAELFDVLPREEREEIFPEERAREAIGITGFTLSTLYRWVTSEAGRRASLHPFRTGRFPGSGSGASVLAQAGLDGESQYRAVVEYLASRERRRRSPLQRRDSEGGNRPRGTSLSTPVPPTVR